ncbi:unnamed protein product [Danaus chrysippus]|uniref:(African queen) hypothetical protein n=1 Tax=Danaus chrysippus TaxID=151541 RepID=A0A8J2QXJ4_9NEOP|nr:unnamed protein product [Danaus chrysippus]
MFVYSVLSVVATRGLLSIVNKTRRALADLAESPPQILIYLHYFNGAIVGRCPLSCADADADADPGNVPVHKCITGLIRPLDSELKSRGLRFSIG